MKQKVLFLLILIALLFLSQADAGTNQPIDKITCQKAIERVYWEHRIWPKENIQPKPLFESMMSDEAIIAKVDDMLKKTNALEHYWNKSISGAQLQAEIEHMAKYSKQPEILKELWQSLHNDPYVIAECLARPILTDTLIRNQYAFDNKFHGQLKNKVVSELKKYTEIAQLKSLSGAYIEMIWKKTNNDKEALLPVPGKNNQMLLNKGEWNQFIEKLAGIYNTDSLQAGKLSTLKEDMHNFYVIAILEKADTQIKIASVSWKKNSFDRWWENESALISTRIQEPQFEYSLPIIALQNCTADTWESTAYVPRPRSNFSTVWTGTEMIVFGGLDENMLPQGSGGKYNPATDQWEPLSIFNAPAGRDNHAAVWSGTEMIVWGGCAIGTCDTTHNSGGRYNPTTDTWTATSLSGAAHSRYFYTAVWSGTEMIVWGGCYIQAGSPVLINSGGKYNPGTDSWTDTSSTDAPSARYIHTAVWSGTEMIVWGGVSVEDPQETNTGGIYNPGTDTWTATSLTNAPAGRWRHSAVWGGTTMIVWGGMDVDGNLLNTGGKLNATGNTWVATSTTNAPAGRWRHTAVWTGTEMILWGGQGDYGLLNSGGKYTPGTDTWTATSTVNVPDPRLRHGSVWTGAEMIVWGGFNGAFLSSGGRYNPTTNSWNSMFDTATPWERWAHSAVWTGMEMIVWGGYDDSSYYNTGGIYNPALDTWSATSLLGAPSPRYGHTALWTGQQMILWGGYDGSVYYNDGARYNPATNKWVATSLTNAASVREFHTAVWNGNEMIVWGGVDGNSWLDTGGKYSPYSDSWTLTSTVNAPVGRVNHTAVWSGTQMFIWGGSYGNFTNTGASYEPSTDTWTTITTTGAPSARQNHTAVWSGSTLIIWGGIDASAALNTGGVFNGSSWSPTTVTDAPSARTAHTAVWAQTEMLVWGGFDGLSSYFGDGKKYNPSSDSWTAMSSTNAPDARYNHTAVATQEGMIVWGGHVWGGNRFVNLNTGGYYCAPQSIVHLIAHKPVVDDVGNPVVNGIIEPDEDVFLKGELMNVGTATANSVTGDLGSFDPTIIIWDSIASYPTIAPNATVQCANCYDVAAPAANRPGTHWDFNVVEWPHCSGCGQTSFEFTYHVGYSFTDVPPSNLFYTYVEKLLHSGATSGCTSTTFCPTSIVQRQAMAKFICMAMETAQPGSCPIDVCTDTFADVSSSNPFCPYIEALYFTGVVAGCQETPSLLYCPANLTQRQAMAKFICIAMELAHPGSCSATACAGIFQDVTASNPFCPYIEALYTGGVVSGCSASPLHYCPGSLVQRNQMAKFIVNAFGFTL